MHFGWPDVAIVFLYLASALAIGLWAGRGHTAKDDFFLAHRAMTWPVVGLSLFASNISSTALVGLAGSAYMIGIVIFDYEWPATIILVLFCIFFYPC
jgi:SSS family solute:Na+ symporter